MGDTRIEKTIRQNRKIARCARFLWVCLIVVACGSNSSWEQRFKESVNLPMPNLSVSPADPDVFSFAMVGDLHVGGGDTSRFRQILQAAQSEGDSFIVLLGDISDKGELESFEAVQTALQDFGYQNKVLPLLGNHDIFGDGWQEYKKIWGASHYTAVVGNSRFIVLDTA
ncbi:metallophosphoesterase, partial [bacterium]|nr:metallophosphoesterase [bacterium]